jgi:hypothetical protein
MMIEPTFEVIPPLPRYATSDDAYTAVMNARDAFQSTMFWEDCGVSYGNIPPKYKKVIPKPGPGYRTKGEFTDADKTEALSIFLEQPDAPPAPTTSGAAKALEKLLKKFDYNLTNSTNKMRQYVLFKLFELAENDDPRLAIKAVEMLGKVTEIGLFSTKIEVSNSDKPTDVLETELSVLMTAYSMGEFGAIEGTYEELTDAELHGVEK